MVDLRELLARALWSGLPRLYDEMPRPGSALAEEHIRCNEGSDAILSALDAAGLVVVPREPTDVMASAVYKRTVHGLFPFSEYRAMLAASPFAKEFK